jgi:hypothetical protein
MYSLLIKYLFLMNSNVYPIWIFIFDADQAQISSADTKAAVDYGFNSHLFSVHRRTSTSPVKQGSRLSSKITR